MTQPLAIPASLSAKLDALEAAWFELNDAAVDELKVGGYSHGATYTPAFRLLLRIEDLQPRFHKFVEELRGSRSTRAAA